MKKMGKVKCPGCGAEVDVTRYSKYASHKHGNVRCGWSGSRVIIKEKNNE